MNIEIKDVVALTGSPGLHRIVKADDRAIVIESMDEKKKRQLIKGNMLISKLTDISIYTTEDSAPLLDILKAIREKHGDALPVNKQSSKNELTDFFGEILPDYDRDRVYPSNIKKILAWHQILLDNEVSLELSEENTEEVAEEGEKESGEAEEVS